MLCLVPALHAARVRLCCAANVSACCVAAAEPAAMESAPSSRVQASIPEGTVIAWGAPSAGWASAPDPLQGRSVLAVLPEGPPGNPGLAAVLRI